MSLPSYGDYKESGIEILGKIPRHWTTRRIRDLASLHKGKLPKTTFFAPNDESDLPYLTMEYLRGGDKSISSLYIPVDDSGVIAEEGDILVLWDGSNAGEFLRAKKGAVSSTLALIKNLDINHKFLYYSLKSIEQHLKDQTVGMGIPHVSGDILRNLKLCLPSIDEQIQICRFLDYEISKIESLLAEQDKLISLLRENRQAIISHAVTRGHDSSVTMKPSGIKWLGEIPDHWGIYKLSSIITKITNGYVGPTRDILVDSGVRYLQSLHIKSNQIRFDTPYFVTQEWSDLHSKSILKEGDVLVVQTGDIGQVAVVPKEFEGCNCHALIVITPISSKLSGAWLSDVLNSNYGLDTLLSIQTGALHPHLNCGNVKDVYIPVPPLNEQLEIHSKLQAQLQRCDELINCSQKLTKILNERCSTLISAAVTGKIDVRNLP